MKRIIDIAIAAIACFVLSPVLVVIYVLIRLTSNGAGIYKQTRVGLGRQVYTIYKFRTMYSRDVTSQFTEKVIESNDDPRITGIGKILRDTSLDELPQLFNVLKGDMSIVGPRPIMSEQLIAIPSEYEKRFKVKPGITGLAQVNGRRSLDWIEQLSYDNIYVENYNIMDDIIIMFKTIHVVIRRSDVYADAEKNWRAYVSKDPGENA